MSLRRVLLLDRRNDIVVSHNLAVFCFFAFRKLYCNKKYIIVLHKYPKNWTCYACGRCCPMTASLECLMQCEDVFCFFAFRKLYCNKKYIIVLHKYPKNWTCYVRGRFCPMTASLECLMPREDVSVAFSLEASKVSSWRWHVLRNMTNKRIGMICKCWMVSWVWIVQCFCHEW
jgi:hypothetical protein